MILWGRYYHHRKDSTPFPGLSLVACVAGADGGVGEIGNKKGGLHPASRASCTFTGDKAYVPREKALLAGWGASLSFFFPDYAPATQAIYFP